MIEKKVSSLTKFYCTRSKLTVFQKFLTFPFNMLFAVFNNKRLENFKFTPNHSILKGWMLVNGKSFQEQMLWNWLRRTIKKVTVFKKYLLLKKFFFWKSSSSKEVPALKRNMFWIFTYSEEKAHPKQLLCWKGNCLQEIADQKKYLLPRSGY